MNFAAKLVFFTVCAVSVRPSAGEGSQKAISEHNLQRMVQDEHEIDENIRKFKSNLEGLRTTVEFEPITV